MKLIPSDLNFHVLAIGYFFHSKSLEEIGHSVKQMLNKLVACLHNHTQSDLNMLYIHLLIIHGLADYFQQKKYMELNLLIKKWFILLNQADILSCSRNYY